MSVEIIKRTGLPNGDAVVTTRQSDPHLIRPFQTFAVIGSSRYAQRLTDHTREATALHAHEGLVRSFQAKESA